MTAEENIQRSPRREHDPEILFQEISELSLRLMADSVPKRTMKELRRIVKGSDGVYPWDAVLERALEDPVDQHELVSRGLRAQRDWVWRGGRMNPSKGVKARTKTFLAGLVAKLVFLVLYTLALVCLLVLVEQIWPHLDISRILHFLQDKLPGLFPRPH